MLRIIQYFSKHYIFHLQGKCAAVGNFWKPYTGQTVGGKLNLMMLTGEVEKLCV
jgi:hypothetical protein